MTQAFYDVIAIKPTYLGITLVPYYIETTLFLDLPSESEGGTLFI